RNAVLATLEVDDPVPALVPAALVARGHAAVHVAAAGLLDRRRQRLLRRGLRDLLERGDRHEAAAGGRGLVFLQCHLDLRSCEDFDFLRRVDLHDRLLPALPRPLVEAAPLWLGLDLGDVDREHADLEQLLDGLSDLRLVRVGVNLERVLLLLDQAVALLGDDRRDDHLAGGEAHDDSSSAASAGVPLASPAPARASSPASAACETSSERAHTTAATSSSDGAITATFSRLRNERPRFSSSSETTTTSGRSLPHASTRAAAVLVEGSSQEAPSTSA